MIKDILLRLAVWVSIIVVTFLGIFGYKQITKPKVEKPTFTLNYNAKEFTDFKDIEKLKLDGHKMLFNGTYNDALLGLPGKNIENFTEYQNAIYSPLVLYVGDHAYNSDSGFSVNEIENSKSSRSVSKDLKTILLAMEEGKTWQDIGINEKCLTGEIKLTIPDENNNLRPYVKELFLINLGEEVSSENIDTLLERAENLMKKCNVTEDIHNFLKMNSERDDFQKVAVVAPEYLMKIDTGTTFYTSENSDKKQTYFVPIYPTKTVSLNYSLYLNNNFDKEKQNSIFKLYSGEEIFLKTGFRTTYQKIAAKNIDSSTINDIQIKNIPQELKNKVHKDYMYSENIQEVPSSGETIDTIWTAGEITLIIFLCLLGLCLIFLFISLAFMW